MHKHIYAIHVACNCAECHSYVLWQCGSITERHVPKANSMIGLALLDFAAASDMSVDISVT